MQDRSPAQPLAQEKQRRFGNPARQAVADAAVEQQAREEHAAAAAAALERKERETCGTCCD